jgi:DnaJ domain
MTHSFQFDPNSILGVPDGASLREIRDAYHQKSLKYHPDKGGDEWAFRMVARAYEILSTARVVNRASDEFQRPASTPRPQPDVQPESEREPGPQPKATWVNGFGPEPASPPPDIDVSSMANIKGWGGPPRSHEGVPPTEAARIVVAELLILRFELECSIDLFIRSPEDRNLSCSMHVTWPVAELADKAETLPGAAKTLKRIGEAFKSRLVRKHALKKQSSVQDGRFEGWLTYPTAVMASEALEAFREAIVKSGLEVEKQIREMAIPRPKG